MQLLLQITESSQSKLQAVLPRLCIAEIGRSMGGYCPYLFPIKIKPESLLEEFIKYSLRIIK